MLSVVAGGLMFASLQLDAPSFPVLFIGAALALVATFAALFLSPRVTGNKRRVP
jgi:hypothetical protein